MNEAPDDAARTGLRLNLTSKAVETIKGLKAETGMTQQAAVERILQWAADQPRSVREELLRRGGDPGAELLKLAREKQADATTLTLTAALMQVEEALAQVKRLSLAYEQRAKPGKKPGK